MYQRPRRNRNSAAIRELAQETHLGAQNLIQPLFLLEDESGSQEIPSLPEINRLGEKELLSEIESSLNLGINKFVLFPVISEDKKDSEASYAISDDNFYLKRAQIIKERFPEACLMSDIALDPYNSDGHDGIVEDGVILNDVTLPILAQMGVMQAEAGFDIIGPSDMMDGRVGAIREALDEEGYTQTSIMSYCAKYASAYYGPFRDALDSAPKAGDKKTYQMDPANKMEALREMELDELEGADMLMVKPALNYLDVIHLLKENSNLPITAYHVSGEYAMVYAAGQKGWLDLDAAMTESLLSIRRAGASGILTYYAKRFAKLSK